MRILLVLILSIVYQLSYAQEAGLAGSRDGRVMLENVRKSKKLYVKARRDLIITSWSCTVFCGNTMAIFDGTGNYLTGDLLSVIHSLEKGEEFSFSNIIALDTSGNNILLASMSLAIFTIDK